MADGCLRKVEGRDDLAGTHGLVAQRQQVDDLDPGRVAERLEESRRRFSLVLGERARRKRPAAIDQVERRGHIDNHRNDVRRYVKPDLQSRNPPLTSSSPPRCPLLAPGRSRLLWKDSCCYAVGTIGATALGTVAPAEPARPLWSAPTSRRLSPHSGRLGEEATALGGRCLASAFTTRLRAVHHASTPLPGSNVKDL